jgi:hypothetical protein
MPARRGGAGTAGRAVSVVLMETTQPGEGAEQEKADALRNAGLNAGAPGAPDEDTQAVIMELVERFTPSHLRLLTLWNDPPAWFASHDIPLPEPLSWAGVLPTSRTVTIEDGLPEMRGRGDLYLPIARELMAAGLMVDVNLSLAVTPQALMNSLTTPLGSQFVKFISPP